MDCSLILSSATTEYTQARSFHPAQRLRSCYCEVGCSQDWLYSMAQDKKPAIRTDLPGAF